MAKTFYWYDYETWGLDARAFPPAQFGGIRTDVDFNVIGEPLVIYSQPTEDMLPDPIACLVTGITPQEALEKGDPEPVFARRIRMELMKPETISLGFNTIRFDEEFNRFLFWRNFYDPYEHTYGEGRSRWDIIDLVRMTRALRPDGIKWPNDQDGKPTNRLELLTKANGISHDNAHDALSDVYATIALAKLIRSKQPKLFNWLFELRDKNKVKELLEPLFGEPIVHTCDMYPSETLKTSLVLPVAVDPSEGGGIVVFDLRQDPKAVIGMSTEEISANIFKAAKDRKAEDGPRLALKTIKFNRAPAIAPRAVLDEKSIDRLKLDMAQVDKHIEQLRTAKGLSEKIVKALAREAYPKAPTAEEALYDSFPPEADRVLMRQIPTANPDQWAELQQKFQDSRLRELMFHYRARHASETLSAEEHEEWEAWRIDKLARSGLMTLPKFGQALSKVASREDLSERDSNILEELRFYAESIMPVIDTTEG